MSKKEIELWLFISRKLGLDDIFMDPDEKRKWAKVITDCLRAKANYEKRKAAGKKVKPEHDPLPLRKEAFEETGKHLAALMTILGVWHRGYNEGVGAIVTKEMLGIWPSIAQKTFIVLPDGRFLKRALKHVKKVASNNDPELRNGPIPPSRELALQSFEYALGRKRDLLKASQSSIYKWVTDPENRTDDKNPYCGTKPPREGSWKAYLREALRAKGTGSEKVREAVAKAWCWADHKGYSVVEMNDIVYRSSQTPE